MFRVGVNRVLRPINDLYLTKTTSKQHKQYTIFTFFVTLGVSNKNNQAKSIIRIKE